MASEEAGSTQIHTFISMCSPSTCQARLNELSLAIISYACSSSRHIIIKITGNQVQTSKTRTKERKGRRGANKKKSKTSMKLEQAAAIKTTSKPI